MRSLFLLSAKKNFYGTLFSRLTGMFRDISLAFFFGGGVEIASFLVAYRFANLLRRLFAEGLVHSSFIPHFQRLHREEERKAIFFFRDAFFSMLIVLGVIIFLLEGSFFWIKKDPFFWTSLKIMLPGLVFLSMYALNSALLHCHNRFFKAAFSPAIFNLTWIVVSCISYYFQFSSISLLPLAVVLGFFLQWMFTLFVAKRYFFREDIPFFRPRLFSAEVRQLLPAIAMGVFAIGATQINSALDAVFAKIADPSGPAYLWYAIRLEQLPLGLFAVAITSALLPELSKKEGEAAEELFSFSIKLTLLFSLFFSFFLLGQGGLCLNFLFGRGAFSSVQVKNTLFCLWGYTVGLFAMALSLVFNNLYYSQKKYKKPMLFSCFSVFLNLSLNIFFLFVLRKGIFGIALATSLSALFQAAMLFAYLPKKPKGFFSFFSRCSLVGFGSFIFSSYWVEKFSGQKNSLFHFLFQQELTFPRGFLEQSKGLFWGALLFTLCFFLLGWLFNLKEIFSSEKKEPLKERPNF